ncbi:hypothetical protein Ndes2526A_g00990 [Nannochloris sp. 'desiccata']
MPYGLHLTGALNVDALRTAISAIMERHAILRMRFFESDEGIVLGSIVDTSLISHPLHIHSETINVSKITAALENEGKRVLDLSKGTVFAACLYIVDDGSSLLAITLHHAAADGWSIGIFNRELSQLYNAAMQGVAADLIALPIQYADYAAWQQDYLRSEARIPGANPLIQVMCQYMPKSDISQPKFAGLEMNEMRAGSLAQAKFDLAFHFSDGGEFAIEYMAELFDGATIERFAESLACLLTDALVNPVQSVFGLSMVGKGDLRLLQRFSKGAARPEFLAEPLVHQAFEVIVASSPSKTCLVYGDYELSYLEVNHRANRLAHWLIENGVKQETIVGVMVERSFDLIISILAILKSGGGYLPLDPSYPPERLAIYAEDAKAAIVLTQSHLLTNAAELGGDGALIKAIDTLDLDSYPVINPGYIGRPDLTKEKFVSNPCYDMMSASLPTKLQEHYRIVYRTGDLVRWRTDGNLEFLGECILFKDDFYFVEH